MSQQEKMTSIPGPQIGYTDLVDQAIVEHLNKEKEEISEGIKKPLFPLRPSSAGHCARKLAYDLGEYRGVIKTEKKIFEPEVYRLLNLGTSVEYSAIKNFELSKKIKPMYTQQVLTLFKLKPIDGKYDEVIEGSCDGVFISEEYRAVFDVKSQKDRFSVAHKSMWDETLEKYRQSPNIEPIGGSTTAFFIKDVTKYIEEIGEEDWLTDNLLQINAYGCTDFMKERGIDHCVIYKYNKNDSRHYELRFSPNVSLFKKLQDKYNLINEAIAKNDLDLIGRPFSFGSRRCAYCAYSQTCWQGENTLEAWFNTFPEKEWPKESDKTKGHKKLEKLFKSFEKIQAEQKKLERIENEIVKTLEKEKISKIKTKDARVYKVKFLKSEGRFVLRRDKN